MKDKKGFAGGLFLVAIFLFILVVAIFGSFKLYDSVKEPLNNTIGERTPEIQPIFENADRTYSLLDGLFAFLYIGLTIATIGSAFFIRSNTLAFIILIGVLFLLTLLAVTLANVYEEMSITEGFEGISDEFPALDFIMDYFPMIVIFQGILFLVTMIAKTRGGADV
jgi:hypothetical protein